MRDGEALPLYLRGERGDLDHGAYPFEHEMHVLQVMESEGLPVPHIYGLIPDPKMIVMDKMPGRFNLATADDEAERVSVLNHYMELLADLHAIDPKRSRRSASRSRRMPKPPPSPTCTGGSRPTAPRRTGPSR